MTAPTLVEHVALGADFNRRVAAEGNMAERTYYKSEIMVRGRLVEIVLDDKGRVAARSRGLAVWERPATLDEVNSRPHGVDCSSDSPPAALSDAERPARTSGLTSILLLLYALSLLGAFAAGLHWGIR